MRRWSDFPSDNADRSVRTWLVQTLQAHGQGALGEVRECKAIADRLMAALDDRSRTLLEALDRRYDESELNRLGQALDRVLDGEPVQYAVGWTEFRGLRIACGPEALIPRPETEEVVSWFLEGMERAASAMGWRQGIRVLDVGTGSGCMALAIKAAKPAWEVWGPGSISGSVGARAAKRPRPGLGGPMGGGRCTVPRMGWRCRSVSWRGQQSAVYPGIRSGQHGRSCAPIRTWDGLVCAR